MNNPPTTAATPQLHEAVDRWLTSQRISESPQLDALAGGSGHRAWRVRAADGDWVFRLRRATPLGYVANHQREKTIWTLAASAGLAPSLHYVGDDGVLWISDFVASEPEAISSAQLGSLMHAVHQLPAVSWTLDLGAQFDRYLQVAADRGIAASQLPDRREHGLAEALRSLSDQPACLCHNDLLADNVLGGPARFQVIDWEYAAMGSPYFDAAAALANMAVREHDGFLSAAFPYGWMPDLLTSAKLVYGAMDRAWRAATDTELGSFAS